MEKLHTWRLQWAHHSAGGCDGRATSEVRGRSREDPMPEGRRPRGVTPRPRSGAATESTRLRRHRNGREELPRVLGRGGRSRGDTQSLRSGAAAGRSYPTPKARGGNERSDPEPWLRGRRRA